MTAATAERPADRYRAVAWQDRARCTEMDPELFFPDKGDQGKAVRQVCAACEVRAECLAYALARPGTDGIWGGTGDHERREMRKAAGLPDEAPPADDSRLAPCGTESAARRHQRHGEPLDEACRQARNRARTDRPDTRQRCPGCSYRTTSQNHRAMCEGQS